MSYPGSDQTAEPGPTRPRLSGSLGILLVLWLGSAGAQTGAGIGEEAVAELAARAMSEFNVPGMAIGIVKSDKVLLSQGYGVLEAGKPDAVDAKTLFKIASNSKAFTAAALVEMARERNVEMPISEAVCAVVEGRISVSGAVDTLLARPPRPEA